MWKRLPLLLAILFIGAPPALATAGDEVAESIDEAKEQYEQGDYGEAVDSLEFAIAKLREKQKGSLAEAFPPPLAGWAAADAQSEYAGMAVLGGGGVSASRKYTKGGESVTVSFLTDSPLIQSMAAMVANPMIVSQDPNSSVTRIKGNKGIEKWEPDDKSGEITIILKNTMLVSVKGEGLANADPLRQYAGAIDYTALKAFLLQ